MLPKPMEILPQQPPFLFVDEYLELDERHCLAKYTFKKDEWFFKGHFPGKPIVPGVILIEALAQAGTVSIALCSLAQKEKIPIEKAREELLSLFTRVGEVDFFDKVEPGETIYMKSELLFFRFGKSEAGGEIYKLVNGEKKLVCTVKSMCGQKAKK